LIYLSTHFIKLIKCLVARIFELYVVVSQTKYYFTFVWIRDWTAN